MINNYKLVTTFASIAAMTLSMSSYGALVSGEGALMVELTRL
jgi:hypothetical protein